MDGGKGQLSQAVKILQELNKSHIPVVGLAKARTESNFKAEDVESTEERFYIPGRANHRWQAQPHMLIEKDHYGQVMLRATLEPACWMHHPSSSTLLVLLLACRAGL